MVGEIRGRILNGTTEGDREGSYTYVDPKGGIVIDYAVINETCQDSVNNCSINGRVDSDHVPLSVELNSGGKERGKKVGEEEKRRSKLKISWRKETIRRYREKTEEIDWKMGEEEKDIEGKWNRLMRWCMER